MCTSGDLEQEKRGLWHRQSHVFQDPFYYVEYGMASVDALLRSIIAVLEETAAELEPLTHS